MTTDIANFSTLINIACHRSTNLADLHVLGMYLRPELPRQEEALYELQLPEGWDCEDTDALLPDICWNCRTEKGLVPSGRLRPRCRHCTYQLGGLYLHSVLYNLSVVTGYPEPAIKYLLLKRLTQ